MAYANNVTRITISGTCFGGAEIWETGFFVGREGADSIAPTVNALGLISDAWQQEFFSKSSLGCVSQVYATTQIKGTVLASQDGKKLGDSVFFNPPTPYNGGAGLAVLPPQVSLCATLHSDLARGIASKGRMYLPGVNISLQTSTGKLATADTQRVATQLKAFLDRVNGISELGGRIILASHGHKNAIIKDPVTKLVTSVRVGDVYDTQRRRRNGLHEVYSAQSLVAG